ncbi:hypothetical protein PHMEG_00026461 [Phytophthora megakarya]|uniref:Uncharacterized protein n=1 Tax=Phytophthora megakarya TaxID=4795 RepID=A0A225V9J3_9STRA|nr:hypothetical protein PHMEG_00026461 [Phytophthora megakarya]
MKSRSARALNRLTSTLRWYFQRSPLTSRMFSPMKSANTSCSTSPRSKLLDCSLNTCSKCSGLDV